MDEKTHIKGRYIAECFDSEGNLKWQDVIDNVVCTVGINLALDTFLAGSSYTVVGPYMGLISSTNYGAGPVAGDTMVSHAGWTEAGGANPPQYTAPRPLCAWAAAVNGSKALSAALAFNMTGAGTVKGSFIVFGTGAVGTVDDTNGILWSAGLFAGGDKTVASGDSITVSYSASM